MRVGQSSVSRTVEYERIAALPRRVVSLSEAEGWADALTPLLALPGSGARLRPWQAYALHEIFVRRGGWLAYPVGQGKTLITWLLASLFNAKRPILVLPASLVASGKTWHDFQGYLDQWVTPRTPPRLITREELALDKNATLLDEIAPDLIVLDESDELSNADSAAARRLDRYRLAHPSRDDVVIVAMTGTPSRLSIMGYWHLLCWCLTVDAPVPLSHTEACSWADALDERSRNPATRTRPGVLGPSVYAARAWFGRRVAETPGVVVVDEDSCDAPLTIHTRVSREDPMLDEKYETFLLTNENPGGIQVSDPLSRWILDGFMGCGLYPYYDPTPPKVWRDARRELAKFVRDEISRSHRSRKPLDTEGQVIRRHAANPIVAEWKRVKGTFDPRKSTRFAWFSESTLDSAIEWLRENSAPGIVWCGSVEYGKRLSARARLPYYGRKGQCAGGGGLHAADPTRSLVASWNACKRGFNLQAWRRALIVMPPQSAKYLEQIVGRVHRSGQCEHVVIDVLLTSGGTIDAFEAALREAEFARATVSLTQKLLRARIEREYPRITAANQYRWASRTKKEQDCE